jgi:hypothetical protein
MEMKPTIAPFKNTQKAQNAAFQKPETLQKTAYCIVNWNKPSLPLLRKEGRDWLTSSKTRNQTRSSLNPTPSHSRETMLRTSEVPSLEESQKMEARGKYLSWCTRRNSI